MQTPTVNGPAIAAWYAAAQSENTPAVRAAYRSFNAQCLAQLTALQIERGQQVIWELQNPYATSAQLFEALDAGQPLRVLASRGRVHLGLSEAENNIFRAVHDYYGHYKGGRNGFGPVGEFRAYLAHAQMFSGDALLALATETLGQNSWVNYGPHAHLAPSLRPYAEQKAVLFPPSLLPR